MKVLAPMPGRILEILVNPGDKFIVNQELVIMESMKMEVPVTANEAGMVKKVLFAAGDVVQTDDVLISYDHC